MKEKKNGDFVLSFLFKSEISMVSMNPTEDLTELTQQLKKALDEKDSHKSVVSIPNIVCFLD